jgi:hypothetical protein
MFSCSIKTISNSVSKLQKLKLIRCKYKIKANGGKIRFVEMIDKTYQSDREKIASPTRKELLNNNNKINNNKINKYIYSGVNFQENTNDQSGPIESTDSSSIRKKDSRPIGNKSPAKIGHKHQVFIDKFNSLRGTRYQMTPALIKLYDYWNRSFSEDQILEAVANIPKHRWLSTIDYSPTIFLRTNKDWIDQCLNLVEVKPKIFGAKNIF